MPFFKKKSQKSPEKSKGEADHVAAGGGGGAHKDGRAAPGGNIPDDPDAADAAANGGDAEEGPHPQEPLGPPVSATTTSQGDGGASLYKSLQQARVVPGETSQTALKVTKSKKANEAINAQSQRVRQKRLMKELKDIQRSDSIKNGVFDVDLAEDNLFEWDVRLRKFDPDSALYRDLAHMNQTHKIDNVWVRISFPSNYPFAPPFVRVLAPLVQGGYVLSGGAICMELLTPEGWSQGYTIESVIIQTMATIVKGKARIVASVQRKFTEAEARKSYEYLVKTHAKRGWNTPPVKDG